MDLAFTQLSRVETADIVALHTDPEVLRHLPLAAGGFDEAVCRRWMADKERQWQRNGYGPWAILIDGRFAGWGGLQREGGDADLALVLSRPYWGHGKAICRAIIEIAFEQFGLESITALLPASRTRNRGMQRLGFRPDGAVQIDGIRFVRYRLPAPRRSVAPMPTPPGAPQVGGRLGQG